MALALALALRLGLGLGRPFVVFRCNAHGVAFLALALPLGSARPMLLPQRFGLGLGLALGLGLGPWPRRRALYRPSSLARAATFCSSVVDDKCKHVPKVFNDVNVAAGGREKAERYDMVPNC